MMVSKLPQTLLNSTFLNGEGNPIWYATSLTLRRNIAKHHFPYQLQENPSLQLLHLLKEPLLHSPSLDTPSFFRAEKLSLFDREYLFERFLRSENFQNATSGQGFLVANSGHLFATLNIHDHLQLQLIDTQGGWEKTWNSLSQIEIELSRKLPFAFSPQFGYLTSAPNYCGTGLTIQAFLHVPALIHSHELPIHSKDDEITITATEAGDQVILSNTYTLGVNEENNIHAIHAMAMRLMALEKSALTHLRNENSTTLKDLIRRALGLLLHSYQLQAKEALDALSLIYLGFHLGWIEGITEKTLKSLFSQCPRAHLLYALGETKLAAPQEIACKRAEFLRKHVQNVSHL